MNKHKRRTTIPAFLSIDVEPDGFQISRGDSPKWPGYSAICEFSTWLRKELTDRSGAKPHYGWYYRMDAQIEQVYGSADVAATALPERTAHLRAEGDYFGVHAHPIRWSDEHQLWVHDFGDRQWLYECVSYSLDVFERWNGAPARHYRAGAGFLSNDIVAVLDDRGVLFDLSLEPVAGWGVSATVVPTGIDESPIVGMYTNCAAAPKVPYRPSRLDFRTPGNGDSRNIVLVPLSTGPVTLPASDWRSKLKRVLHGSRSPIVVDVLYPTRDWPSDRYFWDLVEHQLQSMQRPYLSLAIRTDGPDSEPARNVCRLFAALTQHPLAEHLRFVNPAEVAEAITLPSHLRRI